VYLSAWQICSTRIESPSRKKKERGKEKERDKKSERERESGSFIT